MSCSNCHADVPAGSRWCGTCHTNVANPALGKLASPGRRLGAFILDSIIPLVAFMFIGLLLLRWLGVAVDSEGAERVRILNAVDLGSLIAIVLLIVFIIWELRHFSRGTTLGKHAFGMYVMKEDGRPAGFGTMLLREWVVKYISEGVLFLGCLWILIDKNRQAWHDKIFRTYVVERRA